MSAPDGIPASDVSAVAPRGASGAASHSAPVGFWALVRESLAGTQRDLTAEALGRAILLLAVPMVLEMVMESIFTVADIFWASKLGPDAVSVVVCTESIMTVVYTLAMGLSMGAGALVARRTGEKDPEGAKRAAAQAIVLGAAVSVVLGIVGVAAGSWLMKVSGAPPGAVAVGGAYPRIMLGGTITVVLIYVINAAFRGVGDATIAMRTLWLANGINIVLAPCLTFGWGPFPRMGVTGAAVATTIGRGIGVLYQLAALSRGRGRLRVGRRDLVFERQTQGAILRLSWSGTLQMLVGMASWIIIVKIVSRFGANVIAGYGIAFRVVTFALLPSWGLGNAAATLVGQNLGARQPDRAEQAVWRAALYNFVFLGVVGLVLMIFASDVVRLFSPVPEVVDSGGLCLRIVSAGFVFYAYGMVVTQAFNGAGDTRTPMIINLVCFWLWEIPAAKVLSGPLGMGATGIFFAITAAFSLVAVLGVAMFRRGRWRSVQV